MCARKVTTFDQALKTLEKVGDQSLQQIARKVPPIDQPILEGVRFIMRPEFQATIRDLKDKSAESLTLVKDKAVEAGKDAAKRVDREAHKRPWLFVGVAALFSAFFAFFLGRKTKK